MRFVVDPIIFTKFPGLLLLIAVAHGLDNTAPRPAVAALLDTAWQQVAEGFAYPNPQSHPAVKAWRDAFAAIGVSGKQFPSSIEALVRRALRTPGQPLRINPLVDAYNAVSLRHMVPAGAFDLGTVQGDLHLRLTRAGEPFRPLGEAAPEYVSAGEVAYTDDAVILTRHFVWRQSEEGKITPETRDVFFVAEVLGPLGRPVAEAVLADLRYSVEELFDGKARLFLVSASEPAITW